MCMRNFKTIWIVVAAVALFAVGALVFAPQGRHSLLGRVTRSLLGTSLAQQDIADLSSDISGISSEAMDKWADSIMESYRRGAFSPPQRAPTWSLGQIALSNKYRPNWIPSSWVKPSVGIAPELAIYVDANDHPLCVIYAWYLKGVIFSGSRHEVPEAELRSRFPIWKLQKSASGVYVYVLEK